LRAWVWGFKTNRPGTWIVISANPEGEEALLVDSDLIPDEIEESGTVRVKTGFLEEALYKKCRELAKKERLTIGKRLHAGEMDLEEVTG